MNERTLKDLVASGYLTEVETGRLMQKDFSLEKIKAAQRKREKKAARDAAAMADKE